MGGAVGGGAGAQWHVFPPPPHPPAGQGGAGWGDSVVLTVLTEGATGLCSRAAHWAQTYLCLASQGEFRVAERKITMKEFLQALEDGRVREVFGSGTACQVCPVHRILYQGKVRKGCPWP